MMGDLCSGDNYNIWVCPALTHEEGWLACKQPQMASPPPWWGETGRRRGETQTERENQRVKRKRPESGVKPQREAWGTGEHNDVISIDSQGEQIFTLLYNCYHWTDRKEVGGLFTLNFNSIRHSNAERDLQPEIKFKTQEGSESVAACSPVSNKRELLIA